MRLSKELLLSITVFFLGIIFGLIFFSLFNIKIEPEINISDLISTTVTVFLGIYLGITIASRQSSNRFEKEFLITEVRRITDKLDSDSAFKNTEEIKYEEAKKSFKSLNLAIFNFENILEDSHFGSGADTLGIRNSFKKFRASILGISPKNGIIKPEASERVLITNSYALFRKEVFKMIMWINGHVE